MFRFTGIETDKYFTSNVHIFVDIMQHASIVNIALMNNIENRLKITV